LKAVVLHLAALVTLFWLVCSVEIPPRARSWTSIHPAQSPAPDWRRTSTGWEDRTAWLTVQNPPPARPRCDLTAVHPLNLAILQALLSTAALLSLSPRPGHKV
jgi:hypothetical protein